MKNAIIDLIIKLVDYIETREWFAQREDELIYDEILAILGEHAESEAEECIREEAENHISANFRG